MTIYDTDLDQNAANYVPLSPVSLLRRAAQIYPHRRAVVYGERALTWSEVWHRCVAVAQALRARGIGRGDTVAMISANIPEMFEVHFAVPMAGAVLNAINMRLDAATVRFILEHGEARLFLVDREFGAVAAEALVGLDADIQVVHIDDATLPEGQLVGPHSYEDLVAEGGAARAIPVDARDYLPADEWQAIALNYTSGTTGNPKGVVYHHRGAYLNAVSNALTWQMGEHPVYLWTLPMFHCNGWCFPWTVSVVAGTHVCLRAVRAATIYDLIAEHGVTHMCGAPIVLSTVCNASETDKKPIAGTIHFMTAGAPPPEAVLASAKEAGFDVTHLYGLTEVYGPAVVNAWKDEWDALPASEWAALKART